MCRNVLLGPGEPPQAQDETHLDPSNYLKIMCDESFTKAAGRLGSAGAECNII